eukprot:GHUV01055482.1.p4 GENE.GHUV01055482.1~~GHUV01055482.1.p4  ORF type:complete len:104 (+),score=5.24 GHUV01055482.1:662-973(+)
MSFIRHPAVGSGHRHQEARMQSRTRRFWSYQGPWASEDDVLPLTDVAQSDTAKHRPGQLCFSNLGDFKGMLPTMWPSNAGSIRPAAQLLTPIRSSSLAYDRIW